MLSRYEHLANSDQEDAVLKFHGLKKQDNSQSILFSKICPSCKEKNSADKSHCTKCGTVLTKKLAQQRKQSHNMIQKEFRVMSKVANLKRNL